MGYVITLHIFWESLHSNYIPRCKFGNVPIQMASFCEGGGGKEKSRYCYWILTFTANFACRKSCYPLGFCCFWGWGWSWICVCRLLSFVWQTLSRYENIKCFSGKPTTFRLCTNFIQSLALLNFWGNQGIVISMPKMLLVCIYVGIILIADRLLCADILLIFEVIRYKWSLASGDFVLYELDMCYPRNFIT